MPVTSAELDTQRQDDDVPDRVLLVGSVGLDSVNDVFRTAGRTLGRRLRRVPDGEPGGRRLWISYQYPVLRASPFLAVDRDIDPRHTIGFPKLRRADGVAPGEIRFSELGYAREAKTSYQDFCAARAKGDLPADARFQFCLPTPMAIVYAFCSPKDVVDIERSYEAAMIREIEAIAAALPHRDFCIQWDVCIEMLIWDGRLRSQYPADGASDEEIVARMKRLSAAVPRDVELGFHLCYGDFDGKHFVDPLDMAKMVGLANAIRRAVARPIGYVHMPVPLARDDDAFFQPLRDLELAPETEIYLGVVHAADGAAGAAKRIAAARRYLPAFGIATECGMARARTPQTVTRLLEIHAQSSREPNR